MIDVKKAVQHIRSGTVHPVYVLYGKETYRIDQFVRLLKSHLVNEEDEAMSVITYDLTQTPIQSVIEEAKTVSFLPPPKVILVKDRDLFRTSKEATKMNHEIDLFYDYIKCPSQDAVIVFIVQGDKLDERKKIVKTVQKGAVVVHFSPLGAQELVHWMIGQAKEQHVVLATETADQLVCYAGTEMTALSMEIEKLCLFVGRGGTIQLQDVERLVPRTLEQSGFALVEQIVQLRQQQAMQIFYDLLQQREQPIKIVALLIHQFRMILHVKALVEQSTSSPQMASVLGVHPYVVKKAKEQAAHFSTSKVKALLGLLAKLDYEMKSGLIHKELGLELFLLRLFR